MSQTIRVSPKVALNEIGCSPRAFMDHDIPAKPLRPRPARGFRILHITGVRIAISLGELRSVRDRSARDNLLKQNFKPEGAPMSALEPRQARRRGGDAWGALWPWQ
jgi:hypothetical protein